VIESTVSWLGLIWGIIVLIAITDCVTYARRNPGHPRKARHRRLKFWLRFAGVYFASTVIVVIVMACVMTAMAMKS